MYLFHISLSSVLLTAIYSAPKQACETEREMKGRWVVNTHILILSRQAAATLRPDLFKGLATFRPIRHHRAAGTAPGFHINVSP